ncbi:uncharacterized protein BDR25DRAFT_314362 [Lindgomyces ingoldianus]|uniref:Uncharacterized protein n=1 Tax=Lindgomyces ingoldianus TaxID=673940 RepID=A0ACB6QWT4_9PLEO|nr:uncharacterized protein BDR25DRAFT_314362 [Lindgomyces ingoldianus]KAF2470661.1 hypothetical protein BDR25DRAFT_314362 [Lindgomyces ingoldianus]
MGNAKPLPGEQFYCTHLYDYDDILGETPYRKARRHGNTLLYLPQEVRDKVYQLAFNDNPTIFRFIGDKPYPGPPPLMLASRQMYCEVETCFIRNLKIVIETEEKLKQISAWLARRQTCDGFKQIRTVVFARFDMFRRVSRIVARDWWRDAYVYPDEMSQNLVADPHWLEEGAPDPPAVQFLKRCPNVSKLELGIELQQFLLTSHLFREFDCLLPAVIQLYDLQALVLISSLNDLKFHLRYHDGLKYENRFIYNLIGFIQQLPELHVHKVQLNGVWGLKEWLAGEFRKIGKGVEITGNYTSEKPYPLPFFP